MAAKIPNDLGIKIGTKNEAAWTQIRDQALTEIEQNKRMNIINELVVAKANSIIKQEQQGL